MLQRKEVVKTSLHMLLATAMTLIKAVVDTRVCTARKIFIPQTFSSQCTTETTRLAKGLFQHVVCICIFLDIVFLHVLSTYYAIYLHKISYIAHFS
jgi:hypothetical protein